MPTALIYSPDFDGHREVHVFVYTQILEELGFKTVIAGDLKTLSPGSYYMNKIKSNERILLKDTSIYAENGDKITNKEFLALQKEFDIDLTIFAEADNHIPLLTSQIFNRKKRLKGKKVALFLRPFYYYEKRNLYQKLRFFKNLPNRWRWDNRFFFEVLLNRFGLLDKALFLDEKFVDGHHYSSYLPDVFQQYAETFLVSENPEQRIWIERMANFKVQNKEKFIFLYFGTSQKRRGYDTLLKMAVENDACFVHCGLFNPDEKYDLNVAELRQALKNKESLLETNQYISDPATIDCFFKAINHLVLPYRNFPGSSGVMFQALGYGIPILVAEEGAMGYLVKKYKLGFTYNDTNILLGEQFKKFTKTPKVVFKESIEEYMQSHTPARLKNILTSVFTEIGFPDKKRK